MARRLRPRSGAANAPAPKRVCFDSSQPLIRRLEPTPDAYQPRRRTAEQALLEENALKNFVLPFLGPSSGDRRYSLRNSGFQATERQVDVVTRAEGHAKAQATGGAAQPTGLTQQVELGIGGALSSVPSSRDIRYALRNSGFEATGKPAAGVPRAEDRDKAQATGRTAQPTRQIQKVGLGLGGAPSSGPSSIELHYALRNAGIQATGVTLAEAPKAPEPKIAEQMEADDQEVQETGQIAQSAGPEARPARPIQATGLRPAPSVQRPILVHHRNYRDFVARRIALDVAHFNNVNKEFGKHFTRFRHLEMEYEWINLLSNEARAYLDKKHREDVMPILRANGISMEEASEFVKRRSEMYEEIENDYIGSIFQRHRRESPADNKLLQLMIDDCDTEEEFVQKTIHVVLPHSLIRKVWQTFGDALEM
ncbi:hypothetical protein L5515_017157 [Caenorhabditis briggsae]|uniref:Uncharacterized protein n=1 Tax=Caenorhabditis briggsae TaxID=6238 RepID=A0AAE9FE00_CAEBR|nr:hypothetical protein L5515_017157 [Caenorhabditis briggsae]